MLESFRGHLLAQRKYLVNGLVSGKISVEETEPAKDAIMLENVNLDEAKQSQLLLLSYL